MVSNSILMHSKITDFPKKGNLYCNMRIYAGGPKSKIIYSQGEHRLSEKRGSSIIKRVISNH